MNPENVPKVHVERKDTDTDMYRPGVDVLPAVQSHEYSLSVAECGNGYNKMFYEIVIRVFRPNLLFYFCLW